MVKRQTADQGAEAEFSVDVASVSGSEAPTRCAEIFPKSSGEFAHRHLETPVEHNRIKRVTFVYYRKGKAHRQNVTCVNAEEQSRETNQLHGALAAIQNRISKPAK